ncbi:MAG: ATP-dependent Zn protease [Candidatus Phytoplasma pruni]|uniref:ATP-dependent zinc metalloprotease FtsH n=1 Tax=Poinsettia branch-inducing phytoplasma TaxID=138647 RepID=UPI000377DD1B|nr:ATP-dependent zinc metalloprotease FtsH [Poinsettia branch-inducing phytoplasma]WEK82475.1 MAG: ATP-dependent Zn protease [Candidatus Phytoplasma pruni]
MNKWEDKLKKINIWYIMLFIISIGVIMSLWGLFQKSLKKDESESEILLTLLDKNELKIKPILTNGLPVLYDLIVTYKEGDEKKTKKYSFVDEESFHRIRKEVEKNKDSPYEVFLATTIQEPYMGFGPLFGSLRIFLTVLIFYFLFTSMKDIGSQFSEQFGDKNKTQLRREVIRKPTLTFKDIAGADEEKEEMKELIDFLKNPKKYIDMGARIPKGVLLSGPPGTGKTLLAKAVSGEAGVPFFAASGSDFVEMYVGLGASRVRSLFKNAKMNAPCIIFIDEIEAMARKRGSDMGHSENEQTLNQLLVEMDGYNKNSGVIVIAATNQPERIDSALLRPGRFDRQFTINLPSLKDREAILKLHASNKKIEKDISLEELAKETPGFSGAQLEGILNEAALLATRRRAHKINKNDLSEALDRILIGSIKKGGRYTDKEKKLVSFHEAGHAVIGLTLPNAKKVQKITIIPRGKSGGYNLMLPEEETYFYSKKRLLAEITSYLGGRAAEELFLDDISSGSYDDFKQATKIARIMVTKFGMSVVGLAQYGEETPTFHKDFSESKAVEIDQAVQDILTNAYAEAKQKLLENKILLFKIADYLSEIETLSKRDIDEVFTTGKIAWYEEEKLAKAEKETLLENDSDEENTSEKEEKIVSSNDNNDVSEEKDANSSEEQDDKNAEIETTIEDENLEVDGKSEETEHDNDETDE